MSFLLNLRLAAFHIDLLFQEANCTELLAHSLGGPPRSNSSRGVVSFFRDAQKANAVVVLDGAEVLLASIASE